MLLLIQEGSRNSLIEFTWFKKRVAKLRCRNKVRYVWKSQNNTHCCNFCCQKESTYRNNDFAIERRKSKHCKLLRENKTLKYIMYTTKSTCKNGGTVLTLKDRGHLRCERSCAIGSISLRLLTTFCTFLDSWSVCSSTIFINAESCSWYVEHSRFLFRSSAVNSWILLSFSSYIMKYTNR